MTFASLALIVVFLAAIAVCVKPLGLYIVKVMEPQPQSSGGCCGSAAPSSACSIVLAASTRASEMTWKQYALALLAFNTLGLLLVYLLQRIQLWLPFNPQQFANVSPDSSFNTAVSFVANTNWQGYSGESTMSYFTQMAGLTVQNFLSAATGIAVLVALIRGLARNGARTIGNFWVDMTRATLYILLPMAVIVALALASQGVLQNLSAYQVVTTLEHAQQTLPMGPIASQEAIKELGTNGGGFLNANSAHPFENPNGFTNFLEMFALFVIPAALTTPSAGWSATPGRAGPCLQRWPSCS